MVEHDHIDQVVSLGDADAPDEVPNGAGRDAPPAHATQRRHAGVVPAVDVTFLDQPNQCPLGHHRVRQIQPSEFVLLGYGRHGQALDQPVIERSMIFELQCAQRMRDALDGV